MYVPKINKYLKPKTNRYLSPKPKQTPVAGPLNPPKKDVPTYLGRPAVEHKIPDVGGIKPPKDPKGPKGSKDPKGPKDRRPGFKITIMSGRYDADLDKVRRDIREERSHSDALYFTEQANDRRERILNEDKSWWTVRIDHHFGQAENAISLNKDTWRRHPSIPPRTLRLTNGGGIGRIKYPIYATVVHSILRATDEHVIHIMTHMPYNQQGEWMEAINTLTRYNAELRRRYPNAKIIMAADYNKNAFKGDFNALMRKRFKGYKNAHKGHETKMKENISGAWLYGFDSTSAVVKDQAGSDHNLIRFGVE